jgi:hypothetical protein
MKGWKASTGSSSSVIGLGPDAVGKGCLQWKRLGMYKLQILMPQNDTLFYVTKHVFRLILQNLAC